MHRASRVETAVAYATSTPRERIRYLARGLVEAGVWPPSRGRGVAPLTGCHAACLIIAVAFAEKGCDLKAVVADVGLLPLQADSDSPMAGMDGPTLLHTLSGLLEPDCRATVRLKLYRHAGGEFAADVALEGEDQHVTLQFWRAPHWSGWSRRTWELAPEGFGALRNLLARQDLDNMEFKTA